MTSSVHSLPSFSDLATSNTTGFNFSIGDDSDFEFEGTGKPAFGFMSKTEVKVAGQVAVDVAGPSEKPDQVDVGAAGPSEGQEAAVGYQVEIFKERAKGFR